MNTLNETKFLIIFKYLKKTNSKIEAFVNRAKSCKLDCIRECLDLLCKEEMDLQGFMQNLILSLKDAMANANALNGNPNFITSSNKSLNLENINRNTKNDQEIDKPIENHKNE